MAIRGYTEAERKQEQIKRRKKTTLYLSGGALVIDKGGDLFVVDMPGRAGSPYVGTGRTMNEALGAWLLANQNDLGVVIDITDAVIPAETRRRAREMRKR